MLHDGVHRTVEQLVTHVKGFNELVPFIDILLHETIGLRLATVVFLFGQKPIRIAELLVNTHFGNIFFVQRKHKIPFAVGDEKIRDDGFGVLLKRRILRDRPRVEFLDYIQGGSQFFVRQRHLRQDFVIVPFGQQVKILRDEDAGVGVRRRLVGNAVELQQQALLQGARAGAGRIQLLHEMRQHILHLFPICLQVLREKQLVDNRLQVSMQVSAVIQRAHQIGGNLGLPVAHIHLAELPLPAFTHRLVIDFRLRVSKRVVRRILLRDVFFQLLIRETVVIIFTVSIKFFIKDLIVRKLFIRQFQWIAVVVIFLARGVVRVFRGHFPVILIVNFQRRVVVHDIADFLLQGGVRNLHQMHQLQRQRQADLPLDVFLL